MGLLLLLPQQAIVQAGKKTAPVKEASVPHITRNPEWVETDEFKKKKIE